MFPGNDAPHVEVSAVQQAAAGEAGQLPAAGPVAGCHSAAPVPCRGAGDVWLQAIPTHRLPR